MPLIIISGLPASGKSTRANELREFFTERGKIVKIVSENAGIPKAGFQKNEYFADSQKEKMVRADLKSETMRLLTKDDLIILDAGNYIKGKSIRFVEGDSGNDSVITRQVTVTNCTVPRRQPAPHNVQYFVAFLRTSLGRSMRSDQPRIW